MTRLRHSVGNRREVDPRRQYRPTGATVFMPCHYSSYRLFESHSRRGAYRVQFVDQANPQALAQALAAKPKLVLYRNAQ